jgi:hypothetical protein
MRTSGNKTKVLVAVEPVTLRSALSAALSADPRLDIVELASGAALDQAAVEVDIVLASEAPASSGVTVVLIDAIGRTVEVNGTSEPQTYHYQGLRWLADLLYARPRITNLLRGSDTHFCVTPDRRTPESETNVALPITPIGLPDSPKWGRRTPHLGGTVPPKGTVGS